jgi:hypothetical protein
MQGSAERSGSGSCPIHVSPVPTGHLLGQLETIGFNPAFALP